MAVEHFSVPPFGPIGSDSSAGTGRSGRRMFRADLHVHSRHSGPAHLRAVGVHLGVGAPEAIYAAAKARGMGLVTLTDVDTIDGCREFLDRRADAPDFVISEEVTARDPRTRCELNVLVFDISEAQHRELQRLRVDVRDLVGYAGQQGLPLSLSRFAGVSPPAGPARAHVEEIMALFDRFEIKNGAFRRSHNDLSARRVQAVARGRAIGLTAGSGAHGPARVGRTVTMSFATTPARFLEDLRSRRTWVAGEDGSLWASMADLSRLVAEGYGALVRPRAHGNPRVKGTVTRALLALPLHLVGTPFWRYGLRSARDQRRLRSEHRRLDRLDLQAFQAKARSYSPASLAAGPVSCAASKTLPGPNNRSARWVITKEEC